MNPLMNNGWSQSDATPSGVSSRFRVTLQRPSPSPSNVTSSAGSSSPPIPMTTYSSGGGYSNLVAAATSSPLSAATPPPVPSTDQRYGGGVVRISELRRQGLQHIESGLRLPSINEQRKAAKRTRNPTPSAAPSSFRELPSGSRYNESIPVSRTSRRTEEEAAPLRLSPAESTTTGGPQDCHWFMANGRRCCTFQGKTYKGRSAHKLWTRLKKKKTATTAKGTRKAKTPTARTKQRAAPHARKQSPSPMESSTQYRRPVTNLSHVARAQVAASLPDSLPMRVEWASLLHDLDMEDDMEDVPLSNPQPPLTNVDRRQCEGINLTQEIFEIESDSNSSTSDGTASSSSQTMPPLPNADGEWVPGYRPCAEPIFSDDDADWNSLASDELDGCHAIGAGGMSHLSSAMSQPATQVDDDDDIPLALLYQPEVPPLAAPARVPGAGISILGRSDVIPSRDDPTSVGFPTPTPVLDRFTDRSALDGLGDDELAGMFDLGEEIGGFRCG